MSKVLISAFISLFACYALASGHCDNGKEPQAEDQCGATETRKLAIQAIAKEFSVDVTKCKNLSFAVNLVAEARSQQPSPSETAQRIKESVKYAEDSLKFMAANCVALEELERDISEKTIKEAEAKALRKQQEQYALQAAMDEEKRRAKLPNIRLGMTGDYVKNKTNWGHPIKVNRSVGSWGVHEQWIYGEGQYLYFQNGKLTSWQN